MASAVDESRAVLDFWFGAPGSAERGQARAEWFRKDAAFDALIAQRFGAIIETALTGGLRAWDASADGALAHIVVLDQFTRNVFRDSARAFAGDALALDAARALVAAGRDAALPPHPRSFAYLPFEHSEILAAQDESLRLYTRLAHDAPECAGYLDYAVRHRDIVLRFGRFPHRNALLGRPSTPEELEFLRQPGSRF